MIENDTPGLDRIQRVLGEHERPARGGRPGVDERDLDDVCPLVQAGDVAPRFVVDEPDPRITIEVPGEVPNRPLTRSMMPSLISTPATDFWSKASAESTSRPPPGADDDHPRRGPKIVSDIRDVVAEMIAPPPGCR